MSKKIKKWAKNRVDQELGEKNHHIIFYKVVLKFLGKDQKDQHSSYKTVAPKSILAQI